MSLLYLWKLFKIISASDPPGVYHRNIFNNRIRQIKIRYERRTSYGGEWRASFWSALNLRFLGFTGLASAQFVSSSCSPQTRKYPASSVDNFFARFEFSLSLRLRFRFPGTLSLVEVRFNPRSTRSSKNRGTCGSPLQTARLRRGGNNQFTSLRDDRRLTGEYSQHERCGHCRSTREVRLKPPECSGQWI